MSWCFLALAPFSVALLDAVITGVGVPKPYGKRTLHHLMSRQSLYVSRSVLSALTDNGSPEFQMGVGELFQPCLGMPGIKLEPSAPLH